MEKFIHLLKSITGKDGFLFPLNIVLTNVELKISESSFYHYLDEITPK